MLDGCAKRVQSFRNPADRSADDFRIPPAGGPVHAKPGRLAAALQQAPAPWSVTALGAAAALATAFAHLTTAESAAVLSLVTVAGSLATALVTKQAALAFASGASATVLGDLAVFGLKLSSEQAGALSGLVTFVLGAFLHLAHVQLSARPLPVVDFGPPPVPYPGDRPGFLK
jgi:hypothetical protein